MTASGTGPYGGCMVGRTRFSRPPEDPAVAVVESILEAAASRHPAPTESGEGIPVAPHALWICACVTMDDAPTWLIYDTDEGGVAWCRVPNKVELVDLVDARLTAGGHADPAEVLLWIQGKTSEPWGSGGNGGGDVGVLEELGRKIRLA